MKAEVIEVVQTFSKRGDGKNEVVRLVTEYWSKDGKFLAENDPCPNGIEPK